MNCGVDQTHSAGRLEFALQGAIQSRSALPLQLVFTRNRRRLVSYRHRGGRLEVRVSRYLLSLGEVIVEPIAGFVGGERSARGRLSQLFRDVDTPPPRQRSCLRMNPLGETYDLSQLVEFESPRALGRRVDVPITWGSRQSRRPQRSIRLGSYDFERGFIRIHRRLDHPAVPEWFVGFVVFHELLHHRFGVTRVKGRRIVHSDAFRRAEREHPSFEAVKRWEAECLPRLLLAVPNRRRTR